MRAFLTKCLTTVTLIAMSGSAEAQLTKLLGFERMPSYQRQHDARATQFQEPLPVAAGSNELGVQSNDGNHELGVVSDLILEAPMAPEDNDLIGASNDMEGTPLDLSPNVGEVQSDIVFHSDEMGQPYDIPISDVIPTEGAEIYSTNKWFRGGRWYSRQELVMLLRTGLSPVHIAVDNTTTTIAGTAVLDPFITGAINTKDADFTYEAGTRLSLGKILGRDVANRDHGIEFTFFGLFDYTGRFSLTPANIETGGGIRTLLGSEEANSVTGIGFPIINLVDGFTDSVFQDILYEANFNSFEMNYMIGGRPARDRLVMQPDGRWTRFATPSSVKAFYAGLRYIRQDEHFLYRAVGNNRLSAILDDDGVTVIGTFSDPTDEHGTYRVETDNDLIGFQFGGDVVQKRTDWVLGLNGKVGGLLNFASRKSTLDQRFNNLNNPNDDDEFSTRFQSESLDDETLTFLAEANAYIAYYLRPNTSLRLGYNFLYLNGVATATGNIGLMGSKFPRFELTGDALYHGMNCGFEMTW